MEEKMKYMNVESSLQPKNLILPCPKKKIFFSNPKLETFVLQCKIESPHNEYYLIINPQNEKQLYIGIDDKMPSLSVELPFTFKTKYPNYKYNLYWNLNGLIQRRGMSNLYIYNAKINDLLNKYN